jgi:hypothetical protein
MTDDSPLIDDLSLEIARCRDLYSRILALLASSQDVTFTLYLADACASHQVTRNGDARRGGLVLM